MHTHTHTHMCTYTHTYTQVHIHTHTHGERERDTHRHKYTLYYPTTHTAYTQTETYFIGSQKVQKTRHNAKELKLFTSVRLADAHSCIF